MARGETYSFSTSTSFSNSATVSGGATAAQISITASQSKTFSQTWVFNGPDNSSTYNTRTFYIDWFDDGGIYTRECYYVNGSSRTWQWSQTGIFYEPCTFISYSRDSNR